jgi:hypothetical protein
MPNILSPMVPIFANSDATDVWNPLTRPMRSVEVVSARFAVWLGAMGDLQVKPAWQFTDDLSIWPSTVYSADMTIGAAWKTTTEWTYGDLASPSTIDDGAGGSGAYVRFGVLARWTSAGSTMRYASARVEVRPERVFAGVAEFPPRRVWSQNDDDFVAFTDPIKNGDLSEARAEFEVSGLDDLTYPMDLAPAWQESDDPPNWANKTQFPGTTAQQNDGLYTATDFSAISATKRFVRLGLQVGQGSGSDVRSCIARARFDWR